MVWEQRRELPGVPAADVVARLRHRPASWILPFLQVAAQRAGHQGTGADGAPVSAPHWYRLAMSDGTTARLIWHPHGDGPLFEGFDGVIQVVPTASGCDLVIRGEVDGGEPEAVDLALGTLAATLASALAQPPSDGSGPHSEG